MASPKLARLIIREGNNDLIHALWEILNNTWENNIIIESQTSRAVLRKTGKLEKIMSKKCNNKKASLCIHAPTLLPLILPSVLNQICHEHSKI